MGTAPFQGMYRLAALHSTAYYECIECIPKTEVNMAMLTIRNLPDDVHRALRVRAAQHGRSTEAEVREILACAVKPEARMRMGDALAALGRKIGLANEDIDALTHAKDKTPAEPQRLE